MSRGFILLFVLLFSSEALYAWSWKSEKVYFDDYNYKKSGDLHIKYNRKSFEDKQLLENSWDSLSWGNGLSLGSTLVGVKHCVSEFSFGKPVDYHKYTNKSKEYKDSNGRIKGITLVNNSAKMKEIYSSQFMVKKQWNMNFWWWSYSYVDGCFWTVKSVTNNVKEVALNTLDSMGSKFDFKALKLRMTHDTAVRNAYLYLSNTNNNEPKIDFLNAQSLLDTLKISLNFEAGGKGKWHLDKFFNTDTPKIRIKMSTQDFNISIDSNGKKFSFVHTRDGYYTTPTSFGNGTSPNTNSFNNLLTIKSLDGMISKSDIDNMIMEYSDDDGANYKRVNISDIIIQYEDAKLEISEKNISPKVSEGKNITIGYIKFSKGMPNADTFSTTGFNTPFNDMKVVVQGSKYMLVVDELLLPSTHEGIEKIFSENGQIKFDRYESADLNFTIIVTKNNDLDGDFIPNNIEELINTDKDNPDQDGDNVLDGMNSTSGIFFSDPLGAKSIQWARYNDDIKGYTPNLYTPDVYGRTLGYNTNNPGVADVLIVDSGVETDHEDLRVDINNSYNSYLNDGNGSYGNPTPPVTSSSHGTNVAGVIAARGFNSLGIKGIAPMATVAGYALKSVGRSVITTNDDIENAWTVVGAGQSHIINNSWGSCLSTGFDRINIMNKVNDEFNLNRSFVFAAGNERESGCTVQVDTNVTKYEHYETDANLNFTLNSRYSIAVASINENVTYSSFSSPGANLMVSAAGERIAVTEAKYLTPEDDTDLYVYSNGTSVAAPFVSGVLALVRQECSYLDPRTINYLIATTATKIDVTNSTWVENNASIWHSRDYGHGLINAKGMINACLTRGENLPDENLESQFKSDADWENGAMLVGPSANAIQTYDIDILADNVVENILLTLSFGGVAGHNGQYNSDKFGKLKISLESPHGTVHEVLHSNNALLSINDENNSTLNLGSGNLQFLVRGFLGENSQGTWKIILEDEGDVVNENDLKFQYLRLDVFGYEEENN